MIEFSGFFLLGIFGIVFLILIIMIGVQIYHGFRFGRHDRLTMVINLVFVSTISGIIIITALMLIPVDWSQPFSISPPATVPNLELPEEVPGLELPSETEDFLINQ